MPRKRRRRRRGNGLGSIRKHGKTWQVAWREGGRRHYGHAPDEDTAKLMLAKIASDVTLGRVGIAPDRADAPTLAELAAPWLKRRERTHRAWRDDRSRWRGHLGPFFGARKPHEVDAAMVRRFIEKELATGLAASSVGGFVRLLSTFFADVVEAGHVSANPIASLPRSTRRLYRSTWDPRCTPFIEKTEDIRRLYLALPEPIATMFAVGALAGLRTGEIIGLPWEDIDLAGRRLHIRQQVTVGKIGPLKDSESRVVPLLTPLAPILTAWRLATGGEGLLFRPDRPTRGGQPGFPPQYLRPQTLHRHLANAIKVCGLPEMTWYQATRHTFASQWVLGGGSIEVLRTIMGHSSVTTTERYSHLKPDLFRESAYDTVKVDLSRPAGAVVPLARIAGALGGTVAPAEPAACDAPPNPSESLPSAEGGRHSARNRASLPALRQAGSRTAQP
jgi:integrase